MNHGVKEYWIVDPIDKRILVYFLDENHDIQFELIGLDCSMKSRLFKNFEIHTNDLFI